MMNRTGSPSLRSRQHGRNFGNRHRAIRTSGAFKLILLLSLTYAVQVQAEENYSQTYLQCVNHPGNTTVSLHDCVSAELKVQDRRLNDAYKQLVTDLTPDQKQQMLDAQRQWIKYRDVNCKFYSNLGDTISATLQIDNCTLDETSHRAGELETLKASFSAH